MWQGSFCFERTLFQGLNVPFQRLPTCSLFAGECQVIVAGHVVPLPSFMPDHHHAILSWLEETVWLVWPPVVELLWKNTLSFHVWMLRCWSYIIKIRLQLQEHSCPDEWVRFWFLNYYFSKLITGCTSQKRQRVVLLRHHVVNKLQETHKQDASVLFLNETTGSRIKH